VTRIEPAGPGLAQNLLPFCAFRLWREELVMSVQLRRRLLFALGLMMAAAGVTPGFAAQIKTLRISTTERLITDNPYGDSNAENYSIWCHVYGCLGRYDWKTKTYVGMIADKWEILNPTTWRFHLRTDLKRQDGGPGPTAADVVHSYQRIMTDPDSAQKSGVEDIASVVAVDPHTVDIHTKAPDAPLLSYLFDRLIVTSADLYKKYGKAADNKAPFGWGPYALVEYDIDQRVILRRNPYDPDLSSNAPDRVVYQVIMEPEQRVTALLNGEVDIARLIPPQLTARLQGRSDVTVKVTPSIEQMFIGLNNQMKPWDNVKVREAAAHAIDRDLIIAKLFDGKADRLDGPIGDKSEICYRGGDPASYAYNPDLSKRLLAEAGYAQGGPAVTFMTSNNRFILDRQVSEVMAQMLTAVGFKVNLQVMDYANLWAAIRPGQAPMFYFNRSSVLDPSDAMSQYFETGMSPRVRYANSQVDKLIAQSRTQFLQQKRCALLNEAAAIVGHDAPIITLWTYSLVTGVREGIGYQADPGGEIWIPDVRM
jgi:peptide/nickel transport system substrate-binding protein